MEHRMRKSLRGEDQQSNMQRIMQLQKQYKQQLVHSLMEKDKRFQGFQDFKRSLAVTKSLIGS